MATEICEVKSKGKVVATVEVDQFNSIDEAITKLGDADVLALINRQYKQDVTNNERAKHRPDTASKTAKRQIAMTYCMKVPALHEKFQSTIGNIEAMYAFLDSIADEAIANMGE
jgi:hypothetical protein